MKDFLSIEPIGGSELMSLIRDVSSLRDAIDAGESTVRAPEGKSVANVFFEPSTRTRLSFDLAAQRLGAHVITLHPTTSSMGKGESIRDTVETIAAIGVDVLVVRHPEIGVPRRVAEWTGLPVVNAGDGRGEHPTQALLDVATIARHFGSFEGLRAAIVGDVAHSRVAVSLIHALRALGVATKLVGPPAFLPTHTDLPTSSDIDEGLHDVDIVYTLRVQTERGAEIDENYVRNFQIDSRRASRLAEQTVLMHPGPMNRGVELSDEVAGSARSLVREQVRNGVPARMVVLCSILGGNL